MCASAVDMYDVSLIETLLKRNCFGNDKKNTHFRFWLLHRWTFLALEPQGDDPGPRSWQLGVEERDLRVQLPRDWRSKVVTW